MIWYGFFLQIYGEIHYVYIYIHIEREREKNGCIWKWVRPQRPYSTRENDGCVTWFTEKPISEMLEGNWTRHGAGRQKRFTMVYPLFRTVLCLHLAVIYVNLEGFPPQAVSKSEFRYQEIFPDHYPLVIQHNYWTWPTLIDHPWWFAY